MSNLLLEKHSRRSIVQRMLINVVKIFLVARINSRNSSSRKRTSTIKKKKQKQ